MKAATLLLHDAIKKHFCHFLSWMKKTAVYSDNLSLFVDIYFVPFEIYIKFANKLPQ